MSQAQHSQEVLRQRLEAVGPEPAPGLVVNCVPAWEVVRHGPPSLAVADEVAHARDTLSASAV